jgi:hypothetical protein
MTSCPDCLTAEKNPTSGLYHSGCAGCKERAMAQSVPFHQAEQVGRLTAEYKRVMTLTFGDGWQEAHERIKAWKERLKGKQC